MTNDRSKGGRPSKLNKKTQERIGNAIMNGMPYEQAARLAGISYDTFNNWMKKGRYEKDTKYVKFFNYIKECEAQGMENLIEKIQAAGNESKSWQANAWILERRYPDMFGKKLDIHNTGEMDHTIKIDNLTFEQKKELARKMLLIDDEKEEL